MIQSIMNAAASFFGYCFIYEWKNESVCDKMVIGNN